MTVSLLAPPSMQIPREHQDWTGLEWQASVASPVGAMLASLAV